MNNCSSCSGVSTHTDAEEACKGIDIAVMVGGFPRKAGMERKDVMSKNVAIYKAQASALEKGANPGAKVGWCGPYFHFFFPISEEVPV